MAKRRSTYGFDEPGLWPTPLQEQLLRAAILDGNAALKAWRNYRKTVDLHAEFDHGSFRLLPLLYQNAQRLGIRDPIMDRLKGVYRMAWVENHRLFHRMKPLLQSFNENGIPTVLLKGAAFACEYYDTSSARPMADMDVLVPSTDFHRVVEFLDSSGWQPHSRAQEDDRRYRHSVQYCDKDGQEFDLHWHVAREFCDTSMDRRFWQEAIPFEIDGVCTHRLDTTHNLVHTVIHGIRWNLEPPIRWIADAATLLQTDGKSVDWDEFTRIAQENKITYRLTLGMRYLQERMDASIPEEVMQSLLKSSTTWLESIENTTVLKNHTRISKVPLLLGGMWLNFAEYCRFVNRQSLLNQWIGFFDFLRYRWRLNRRRDIPAAFLKRSYDRIRRLLSRELVVLGHAK